MILPRCAFTTWFPYKNGSSPAGLIQTYVLVERGSVSTSYGSPNCTLERLKTDLVLGVLSQVIQTPDLQLELSGLTELSKACSERNEIRSRDGYREVHRFDGKVINSAKTSEKGKYRQA